MGGNALLVHLNMGWVLHWKQLSEMHTLTNLRSITSCSMNRIRDEVFLSLTIFSIWLKYWSIRGWWKRQTRFIWDTKVKFSISLMDSRSEWLTLFHSTDWLFSLLRGAGPAWPTNIKWEHFGTQQNKNSNNPRWMDSIRRNSSPLNRNILEIMRFNKIKLT